MAARTFRLNTTAMIADVSELMNRSGTVINPDAVEKLCANMLRQYPPQSPLLKYSTDEMEGLDASMEYWVRDCLCAPMNFTTNVIDNIVEKIREEVAEVFWYYNSFSQTLSITSDGAVISDPHTFHQLSLEKFRKYETEHPGKIVVVGKKDISIEIANHYLRIIMPLMPSYSTSSILAENLVTVGTSLGNADHEARVLLHEEKSTANIPHEEKSTANIPRWIYISDPPNAKYLIDEEACIAYFKSLGQHSCPLSNHAKEKFVSAFSDSLMNMRGTEELAPDLTVENINELCIAYKGCLGKL